MNFLVTGGLGFIGSHFIENCLSKGDKVTNIDAETYAANDPKLFDNQKKYTYIKGDIRNNLDEYFKKGIPKFDFIVNFAAESHVDNSIENQSDFITTNFVGAGNVFKFALQHKIPVIQISTDEVFGDYANVALHNLTGRVYVREGVPSTYNILDPSSPYSSAKASAELLLRSFGQTYAEDGFQYAIVRFSNAYGPRQHVEKLLPKAITNILNNKDVPIYAFGEQERQWTYVEDIAKQLHKYLESDFKNKDRYHICADDKVKNITILSMIAKALEKSIKMKFVKDRKGHDQEYYIQHSNSSDCQKMTNLEVGLMKTIQYYKNVSNT